VHIWLFGRSSRIVLDSKEILSLLVQVHDNRQVTTW
jgi:hypothetical protein